MLSMFLQLMVWTKSLKSCAHIHGAGYECNYRSLSLTGDRHYGLNRMIAFALHTLETLV